MRKLLEKIHDLNALVLQGKALEAFDKYYHPEVVMQENEQAPTVGKSNNRAREEAFFAAITEFRDAKPLKVSVGDHVTMVEWYYDYTHRDWGKRTYTQVSVQRWQDDLIIEEKFYYSA